jgi:hypothetical protein
MGLIERGKAPRVFVSSTIDDLADLRSSIKYFLEESGFEVVVSEFPTFPHELDETARLASVRAIEAADYYVLLIGHRYGSQFDDGTSVTRAEYRRARALAAEGRILLFPFARGSVFDAWRHRIESVPDCPDWPSVRAFLDEVAEERPGVSNWIHRFDSFRDVADWLQAVLGLSRPLRRRSLEANLLWELRENLKTCHYATVGHPPRAIAGFFHNSQIPEPGRRGVGLGKTLHLTKAQAHALVEFNLMVPGGARGFKTRALDDAVSSGEFLEFDAVSATYRVGDLQAALLDLRGRLLHFDLLQDSRFRDKRFSSDSDEMIAAARREAVGGTDIYATTLRILYATRNQLWNIQARSTVIARFLAGISGTLEVANLVPVIPEPAGDDPWDDREMTDLEIGQYLASPNDPVGPSASERSR